MKKLIEGIVEFRKNTQASYRDEFGKLATGQFPDALFIACSDSRVVPNTFASTNPGDLFVMRNVGNLIPPCDAHGVSVSDESEASAIEYAVMVLNVANIIVCGHSECGAMRALIDDRSKIVAPNLKNWLRHGDPALKDLQKGIHLDPHLADHNQLSQLNVLRQIEHIKSYPAVKERVDQGTLGVHGWWFDITHADVYGYNPVKNKFVLIEESSAEDMLKSMCNSHNVKKANITS